MRIFHLARRNPGRPPAYVTWTIVIVNVFWFLVIEQVNGFSIQGLISSGALAGQLLTEGQWYRVLSSMFVHVTMTHILFNMVSLVSLSIIEFLIGWAPYVLLYTLSGLIGGSVAAWLTPNVVMAGASAAIFGVFGAALVLAFRGVFSKVSRNQMLLVLAINLVYDFTNPQIGITAHVIGLLVGAGWIYLYPKIRRYTRTIRTGAVLCVGAMVLCLMMVLVPLL